MIDNPASHGNVDEGKGTVHYIRKYIIPIHLVKESVYIALFLWAGWFIPDGRSNPASCGLSSLLRIIIASCCIVLMVILILKIDRNAPSIRLSFYHAVLFVSTVVLFFPLITGVVQLMFWAVPIAFMTADVIFLMLLSYKAETFPEWEKKIANASLWLLPLISGGIATITAPFTFPAYDFVIPWTSIGSLAWYFIVSMAPAWGMVTTLIELMKEDIHCLADVLRLDVKCSLRAFKEFSLSF